MPLEFHFFFFLLLGEVRGEVFYIYKVCSHEKAGTRSE